jgi:hypothetical protein
MKKVLRKCLSFILIILIIRETDVPDVAGLLNGQTSRLSFSRDVDIALMSRRLKIMRDRAQKMTYQCSRRGRAIRDIKPVGNLNSEFLKKLYNYIYHGTRAILLNCLVHINSRFSEASLTNTCGYANFLANRYAWKLHKFVITRPW